MRDLPVARGHGHQVGALMAASVEHTITFNMEKKSDRVMRAA
jgi:hypothetical protein